MSGEIQNQFDNDFDNSFVVLYSKFNQVECFIIIVCRGYIFYHILSFTSLESQQIKLNFKARYVNKIACGEVFGNLHLRGHIQFC